MKITKYAHACLGIEVEGAFLVTDPGKYNPLPVASKIDAILITHEHTDHCDIAQIQELRVQHPEVRIITHKAVGDLLAAEQIPHEVLSAGDSVLVQGVRVESVGSQHAVIYKTSPCQNTGFFIADTLYIPGDALHDIPSKKVRVLALPVAGPWMRLADAIDYAKKVQPEIAFPIHDAIYVEAFRNSTVRTWIQKGLEEEGIPFVEMGPGEMFAC